MQVAEDDVFISKLDSKGRVTVPKDVRDEWRVSGGDRVEIAVVGTDAGGYECDECGFMHPLPEVLVLDDGDRVVCADCAGVEDRIVG